MQPTPSKAQIERACRTAETAIRDSAEARGKHRRHKRLDRRDELAPVMRAMKTAARPIRRFRGMALAHEFDPATDKRLRQCSDALTRERRKLQKMIDRSPGLPRS